MAETTSRSRGAASRKGSTSRRAKSDNGSAPKARGAGGESERSGGGGGSAAGRSGGEGGGVASKAKGPALAGGAALVGLAGGLALGSRGGGPRRIAGVAIPGTRKPLVKLKGPIVKVRNPRGKGVSKDLLKAAEEVGSAGRQVNDLVGEVRRVRDVLEAKPPASVVKSLLTGLGRAND